MEFDSGSGVKAANKSRRSYIKVHQKIRYTPYFRKLIFTVALYGFEGQILDAPDFLKVNSSKALSPENPE
jgi:hypothetical protein